MQLTENQQEILNGVKGETLAKVMKTLVKYGEVRGRPSIGITVGPIPENAAEHYELPIGLYVSDVSEGSDAKEKGIVVGDIIIACNGEPVDENEDIISVKNSLIVGDSISFTVWRDGETFDVDVVLVDTNDIY